MEMIAECAPKFFVVSGGKRRGDRAGVPAALDGAGPVDARRKNFARLIRRNSKSGNQKHKSQARRDAKFLMLGPSHDVEATELGWRCIIRMSFHLRAHFENLIAIKRTTSERVQSMQDTEADRNAAAETTARRDIARD